MHPIEMHVAAISGGTPTGTASPYTYAYTFDETGSLLESALKPYTVQYGVKGSTQDEWRGDRRHRERRSSSASTPCRPRATRCGRARSASSRSNREVSTITAAQNPPTPLETMEGHLTTLAEGRSGPRSPRSPRSPARSSSSASAPRSTRRAGPTAGPRATPPRPSAGAARARVEFDALIGISATAKTDILDIYNVSGGLATERRWRITVTGSGVNTLTIDARVRFRAVDVGEHEDERLYAVNGVWVYDSTLGGRGKFTLTNAVSTIP
jgi:hypothetical protein